MMQCGIVISPLIHYRLSQFVFWHGWLWPGAPVYLAGCFHTWLSSRAIGIHPHMNVPATKSKKTHSHEHTHKCAHTHPQSCWVGLQVKVEVSKKQHSHPSCWGLFLGNLCKMISVFTLKLPSKSDISNINFVMVAVCRLTFEQVIKK